MSEGVDLIQIGLNTLGPVGTAGVAGYFLREWLKGIREHAREHEAKLKQIEDECRDRAGELRALIKDVAKCEGTDENQQRQLTIVTQENAELKASIRALWAVLERERQAPKRLSDGG